MTNTPKSMFFHFKDNDKQFFTIISVANIKRNFIDIEGQPAKESLLQIDFINIFDTLSLGRLVLDTIEVESFEHFDNLTVALDPAEYPEVFYSALSILEREYNEVKKFLSLEAEVIGTMKYVINNSGSSKGEKPNPKKGNIFIQGNNGNLAQIVFNMIKGGPVNLEQSEVEKIATGIIQVVMPYVDSLNTDNPKEIESIQNLIELSVIENLPNRIQMQDLKLDVKNLIEEIKKAQNGENQSQE